MKDKDDNSITDLSIANECLCSKLRATSRVVSRAYDHALKPVGLKSNQMTILIAVSLTSPISITGLSEKLSMERTTLTRNLKPLEASGFIQLNNGHGRTRELSLTEQGRIILDKAKPLWESAQRKLVKELGQEESDMVSALLKQILNVSVAA